MSEPSGRARANPFGVWDAALGLVAGFLLASLAVALYDALAGPHPGTIGADIVDFLGLWTGFVGACVLACRTGGVAAYWAAAGRPPVPPGDLPGGRPLAPGSPEAVVAPGEGAGGALRQATRRLSLKQAYGLSFRWIDLPLGVVVGAASQYLLVPVLVLPLQPFVHNLNEKLSKPANHLLGGAASESTAALVVLTVLVCLGSPFAEELFFRGLLLRGLLGRFASLGRRIGPALSILVTGVVFGLVHFETLQFLGLAGFGIVLSYLAYRTGRLGPSILAHVTFNTSTVIAYVLQH